MISRNLWFTDRISILQPSFSALPKPVMLCTIVEYTIKQKAELVNFPRVQHGLLLFTKDFF